MRYLQRTSHVVIIRIIIAIFSRYSQHEPLVIMTRIRAKRYIFIKNIFRKKCSCTKLSCNAHIFFSVVCLLSRENSIKETNNVIYIYFRKLTLVSLRALIHNFNVQYKLFTTIFAMDPSIIGAKHI